MIDYTRYKTILARRDGRVLTLSFNRPETLNAFNADMHREIGEILVDARHDQDADIIVLTGEGRAFSAGGDVTWMQDGIDNPSAFEASAQEARAIVFNLLDLDKPVICKMNGHAVGLGATIALLCDVVIAADSAKIGDPHVSMGLVAGDGGAVLWPQMIGYTKAKYYLMTGDLISATEAERIGLITKVVPREALDGEVEALSQRLAKGAVKAIRWTKVAANLQLKAAVHASFDAGIAYETVSNVSADHREAVEAFRAGRAPVFTGR